MKVGHIQQTADPKKKELVEMQAHTATALGLIYQAVAKGECLTPLQLHTGDRELRKLHSKLGAMRLNPDGVLCVQLQENGRPREVVLCPTAIRREIVWDAHNQVHSGFMRTLQRIRLSWYWPGMTRDVRSLLARCEVCQAAKHGGAAATAGTGRLHCGRPWQVVAVDLVGPMPTTPRGNTWILVLTDHFTRWSDALAIPDATAPVVARALDERVFCYLGLPESIHSDQGAQF